MGTSVLIITHNLGVIARYANRVNVMYAGKIVESGMTRDLFTDPQHPYTKGLLKSVQRLDQDRTKKLSIIDGTPPDLINMPQGCAFQPRCTFAVSECSVAAPALTDRGNGHMAACFVG